MALKIKSTKVVEDIVNEKDEVIGKVSFDPKDATSYRKFLDLVEHIEEKQRTDKEIGKIDNISNSDLNNIDNFEKNREMFNKIGKKLDNYLEMIEEIKLLSNEIFGNVSNAFEQICGQGSIEPYLELIEWATPYFKQGRTEKVTAYLNDKEDIL